MGDHELDAGQRRLWELQSDPYSVDPDSLKWSDLKDFFAKAMDTLRGETFPVLTPLGFYFGVIKSFWSVTLE